MNLALTQINNEIVEQDEVSAKNSVVALLDYNEDKFTHPLTQLETDVRFLTQHLDRRSVSASQRMVRGPKLFFGEANSRYV